MSKQSKIFGGDRTYLYIAAVLLIIHCVVWMFSGNSPLAPNPYNSYVLQAEAWKDGSLDLGRGFGHLELAEYDHRFFVSFPQFPAMFYFLFVLPGLPVPEGPIALGFAIAGAMLCYSIGKKSGLSRNFAFVLSLAMTCGSNMLMVSVTPWVWFIAQNMCFTLTVASLYFALSKKPFLCFLFWAFAIGCRPFQILYFPLLCMIICRDRESYSMFFKKPYVLSGALVMGVIYMWLNFARFGNVFEFGHTYLPEFTESAYGQFHISYLKSNLYSLIRFPEIMPDGSFKFPEFDGMNLFIASPVFAYALYCYCKKFKVNRQIRTTALITIIAELFIIALHKTMGGWQFGNRYTNDCLPLALIIIAMSDIRKESYPAGLSLITLYGILINVAGTILCYINA